MTLRSQRLATEPLVCAEVHLDAPQHLLQRSLAAILGSHGVRVDEAAFELLAILAEQHMFGLYGSLHKLTQTQRRLQPSLQDLGILMRSCGVRLLDLEDEMRVQTHYSQALQLVQQEEAAKEPEALDQIQASFFASSYDNARRLFPSFKKRGDYIPEWMPELPPDHTFMATPRYTQRITDPREMREKIVEEGRLAEKALRRLIGTIHVDDHSESDDEDEEGQELVEVVMEEKDDDEKDDDEKDDDEKNDEKNDEKSNEKNDEKDNENNGEKNGVKEVVESKEQELVQERNQKEKIEDDEIPSDEEPLPETFMRIDRQAETTKQVAGSISPMTVPGENGSQIKTTQGPPVEDKPKKPLALKISLTSKLRASLGDPKVRTMTAADRAKYDPFGVKTTSKKFDVEEYVHKRQEIIAKRAAKRELAEEKLEVRQVQQDSEESGPPAEVILRDFNAAFASIVQHTNPAADKNVQDRGLVNWDRERYV